jgi:hypothetical protein
MRPEFERTVEGCDYNVRSKFASILNTLHCTVSVLTALLSVVFSVMCMGYGRHVACLAQIKGTQKIFMRKSDRRTLG